jgi:hypothetical protein
MYFRGLNMISKINNEGIILLIRLAKWRNESNISKAKRIQKVMDRLEIRQNRRFPRWDDIKNPKNY